MTKTKMCPRGHGELRRDSEGFSVCITCGYEEPPKELTTHNPDRGKYSDKPIPQGYEQRQGFRYPEDIKIQAAIDLEKGASEKEILDRVGCCPETLQAWKRQYRKRNF